MHGNRLGNGLKEPMNELPNKSVAFVAETDFQVIQEISTIEVINIITIYGIVGIIYFYHSFKMHSHLRVY